MGGGALTLLSALPRRDQAAVVDLVAIAIDKRRLLRFGTLCDEEPTIASAVIRRLQDHGATWDMGEDKETLTVTGWKVGGR